MSLIQSDGITWESPIRVEMSKDNKVNNNNLINVSPDKLDNNINEVTMTPHVEIILV